MKIHKIIYAESDSSFRDAFNGVLKYYLKENGIKAKVDNVNSGKKLSDNVIGGEYDLTFADSPFLDAVDRIRAAGKKLPIYVIVRGYPSVEQLALEHGATGYIDKADERSPEKLGRILIKHLTGK